MRYARTAGFGGAEADGMRGAHRPALAGALDVGDVWLCPGVIVEVKAGKAAETASDGLIDSWLDEAEVERINAGADVGILVTKRKGVGAPNAGRWWAHLRLSWLLDLTDVRGAHLCGLLPVRMTLADALLTIRAAGYGDPVEGDS